MTEPEDPSRERLKQHFAQRVIHQARQILEIWQRLQRSEWSNTDLSELSEANLRLLRFAERGAQLELDTLNFDLRQAYKAQAEARIARWELLAQKLRVLLMPLSTQSEMVEQLREYLNPQRPVKKQ